MNSRRKSVTPNILIKAINKTITNSIQAQEKKISCFLSGEIVREKKIGPSTGVYCLQPILIRSEHTGIRGSHMQVLEGIHLIQKKGFILKTFEFLLFNWLFICD